MSQFNSNNDFAIRDSDLHYHQTPQAFSHFSWEQSSRRQIVVDVQGHTMGLLLHGLAAAWACCCMGLLLLSLLPLGGMYLAIVWYEVLCALGLSYRLFIVRSCLPNACPLRLCATGVGEYYTDPQIHTVTGEGYGEGNLGATPLTVAAVRTCVVSVYLHVSVACTILASSASVSSSLSFVASISPHLGFLCCVCHIFSMLPLPHHLYLEVSVVPVMLCLCRHNVVPVSAQCCACVGITVATGCLIVAATRCVVQAWRECVCLG